MENLFLDRIQEFGDFINWPFLFMFMMIAWIINQLFKKSVSLKILNRTFLRTLLIGILIGIVFFFLGEEQTRFQVLRLACTVFFAMFIMWDGLKKWIDYLKEKFSFKRYRHR